MTKQVLWQRPLEPEERDALVSKMRERAEAELGEKSRTFRKVTEAVKTFAAPDAPADDPLAPIMKAAQEAADESRFTATPITAEQAFAAFMATPEGDAAYAASCAMKAGVAPPPAQELTIAGEGVAKGLSRVEAHRELEKRAEKRAAADGVSLAAAYARELGTAEGAALASVR